MLDLFGQASDECVKDTCLLMGTFPKTLSKNSFPLIGCSPSAVQNPPGTRIFDFQLPISFPLYIFADSFLPTTSFLIIFQSFQNDFYDPLNPK
jgi:hypothetical protein